MSPPPQLLSLSVKDPAVSAQPLRVAVYSAIAAAIRAGDFVLGSLLPTEAELGRMAGVSRTVVREALMLLEEDGLVRTRRGIGRFVANTLPRIGLEQIMPIERLMGDGQSWEPGITLTRTVEQIQEASDFMRQGLGLSEGSSTLIWESVIHRDGVPVALSLESIPVGLDLAAVSREIASTFVGSCQRRTPVDGPSVTRSLMTTLTDIVGPILGPGACTVSVGVAGAGRAGHLGVAESDPVLVVTQSVMLDGRPLYYAKHLIVAHAAGLLVVQQSQASL